MHDMTLVVLYQVVSVSLLVSDDVTGPIGIADDGLRGWLVRR